MADEQTKVPVYFIGVEYPANIGTLMYNVRGKSYVVPRTEDGAPEVGAALMADPNDIPELISKARYFDGKKNVEVFTTDEKTAASVTSAFAKGKIVPIEAKMVGSGGDIIIAPTKEEVLAMLTDAEVEALVRQRNMALPTNLSSDKFLGSADESALARAAKVQADIDAGEAVTPVHETSAQKKKREAKEAAAAEMATKQLES